MRVEREMAQWLREGKVRYREDAVDGLVNAVATFKGLFRGQISASYSSASPPNRIGPRPVSRNKAISITQFIRAAQKQFRISPLIHDSTSVSTEKALMALQRTEHQVHGPQCLPRAPNKNEQERTD